MSGWKSTKDGKHFQTGHKPGINSSHSNHSSNSGSQSSSMNQPTHRPPEARVASYNSLSGKEFREFKNSKKGYWWMMGSGGFVSIPEIEGRSRLKINVDLPDGKYTIGTGNIRENIEIINGVASHDT